MIHSVEESKIYSHLKKYFVKSFHYMYLKVQKVISRNFCWEYAKKNNFRNMISAHILKKFREMNLQFWFTKAVGFTKFSLKPYE